MIVKTRRQWLNSKVEHRRGDTIGAIDHEVAIFGDLLLLKADTTQEFTTCSLQPALGMASNLISVDSLPRVFHL